jgi:hypothetical protein
LAFEKRSMKPSPVSGRAVAGESGAHSGNPRAQLAGLAHQVAPQGYSRVAQSRHFLLQSHRRFG